MPALKKTGSTARQEERFWASVKIPLLAAVVAFVLYALANVLFLTFFGHWTVETSAKPGAACSPVPPEIARRLKVDQGAFFCTRSTFLDCCSGRGLRDLAGK
jgi:hypothetical protein